MESVDASQSWDYNEDFLYPKRAILLITFCHHDCSPDNCFCSLNEVVRNRRLFLTSARIGGSTCANFSFCESWKTKEENNWAPE